MIDVKVGGEFPVAGALSKGGDKPYFKVNVCAEKGYDKIAVWATNPAQAKDIVGMAKVKSIQSVRLSAHQYNGKWYPDYTVNAELVQGSQEVTVEQAFNIPVDVVDDNELPFN